MAVRHYGVRARLCLGLCLCRIASWRQHLCRTHVVEGRLLGRANLMVSKVFARDLRARRSCRDVLDVLDRARIRSAQRRKQDAEVDNDER
jgi:hypothetical protein